LDYKKRQQLLDSPHKIIFKGPSQNTLLLHFKDDHELKIDLGEQVAPSQNVIHGKGAIHNRFSEILHKNLLALGIATPFIKRTNMREQLLYSVDPFPFFVQAHMIAFDHLVSSFNITEGTIFEEPFFEMIHKNKDNKELVVSTQHINAFEWLYDDDVEDILTTCQRIIDFLTGFFAARSLKLAKIALQFGYTHDSPYNNEFVLANDWSFDQFSLIDSASGVRIDINHSKNEKEATAFYSFIRKRFQLFT
jgi:phosphoribosylaminoimidazole-succinocarboxamide synthase